MRNVKSSLKIYFSKWFEMKSFANVSFADSGLISRLENKLELLGLDGTVDRCLKTGYTIVSFKNKNDLKLFKLTCSKKDTGVRVELFGKEIPIYKYVSDE